MIFVLLSWGIMLVATFIFGYCAIDLIYNKKEKFLQSVDVYTMCGLMIMTVYAEIFSLFYKVGIMACFILSVLGLGVLILLLIKERKQIRQMSLMLVRSFKEKPFICYVIGALCILATLIFTVQSPKHYDTALYHAQAVRWIEEYGIVPGLGNLHNRLAYNSAFMPLQALFSLQWLLDQSLHTLNGFICVVLLIYAVVTNNLLLRKKLLLSDFFKFALIIYICMNREYISSLSSDILAMLLVIYIFSKWCENFEGGGIVVHIFMCSMCMGCNRKIVSSHRGSFGYLSYSFNVERKKF